MMPIETMTFDAWEEILSLLDLYWGPDGARIRLLHHPFLFHEFGDTAYMIHENGRVSAYLLGFMGTREPRVAYCHLVSVHPEERGRGLGRLLYEHFGDIGRERGCYGIKAVTGPDNVDSMHFHTRLGFELQGEDDPRGVPISHNYWGGGIDRMVFLKKL